MARYSFSGFAFPGATTTYAFGVNAAGQRVGGYQNGTGRHGFLYSGGAWTNLDVPGAANTTAYAINASGQIVGNYTDASSRQHGFLFSGGSYSTYDYPGALSTSATGINDAGQVVGYYLDGSGFQRGFLYSGGTYSTLSFPGALNTYAYGINSSGQVVGYYQDANGVQRGFLYGGGSYSSINYPGASTTYAYGINDSGQITGNYRDSNGLHGFVYGSGSYSWFDYPGTSDAFAAGINNAGQVIGSSGNGGFVATLAAKYVRNDVNGDGYGDLIWQNTSGLPAVWTMRGGTGTTSIYSHLNYANPGANWRLVGSGDLNGDGQTDLVWQKNDGLPSAWLTTSSGSSVARTPVFTNPSVTWRMVAVADLDGDGRSELLWQNSQNGALSAWILAQNGESISNYLLFDNPGTPWRLVGAGDLNGDGRSDLVFQNTSGAVSAWLMGGNVGSPSVVAHVDFDNPGPSWTLVGTGDLNGDGRDDLLFQNGSTGQPSAWLMNSDGRSVASRPVFNNPGTSWRLVGATDANGDGRSDLVWQENDGLPSVWLVGAGGTTIDSTPVLENPGANWKLTPDRSGASARQDDVTGTGRGTLLWQNTDGRASVWAMQGGAVGAYLNYANPGAEWRLVGTGDLNGDGRSDLLWQKNDGLPSAWLIGQGGRTIDGTPTYTNPGTDWRLVGGADVDADGQADLLWQNSQTGAVSAWISAPGGTGTANYVLFDNPGASWRLVGGGDLNGDGRSDLVFQNTSGAVSAWLMGGSAGSPTVAARANFDNPGPSWSLVGTGDLNGDGRDDLLWQNSGTGQPSAWLVNPDGLSIASRPVFDNPGTSWRLVGTTDANGDGRADLVWQNSSGLPSLWLMGAGGTTIDSTPVLDNPGTSWKLV